MDQIANKAATAEAGAAPEGRRSEARGSAEPLFRREFSPDPSQRWLKAVLRPLTPAFREVAVVSLFVNFLAVAVPIFVLQVYDRVVFYSGLATLAGLAIGVVIALAFDFILRQARSRMLQKVALKIDVHLGRKLFAKIQSLPLRILESRPASHWQTLFRDIELVRNVFSGPSAMLITDLPFAVIFLIVILTVAKPIAWVLLIIIPLFVAIAWRSGRVVDAALAGERRAGLNRDELLSEVIAGRATVKALALDEAVRPAWEERHATTIEQSMRRGSHNDGYVNLGFVMMMGTTVALVTVGALAIINHEVTLGALIATVMLSNRIIMPFNQLVGTWRNLASFKQAVARLDEVFKLTGERQSSALELARPAGRLTLEHVSFGYRKDAPPVIDDLSIDIRPGGMVGLVGRNGSGKTTLIKLLAGLYVPECGRVLLDGADICQFTRRELARWIGYVPQECVLFAGSIRDNIAIVDPEASDDDIRRAAELAGVHEYVIDLPDGYATEIGEAGSQLSGGQRQRIAIARALLGDPPVLLLDEVTGNLDAEAEVSLRDSLIELARDHTIIIVTHTPPLLRACRSMIVLDKGKLALAGPTAQVLPKMMAPPRAAAQSDSQAGQIPGPRPTQAIEASPGPRPVPAPPRPAGGDGAPPDPEPSAEASRRVVGDPGPAPAQRRA